MKNKFYLKEFKHFDGEDDVTFNIIDVNEKDNKITVAITRSGKISVCEYDLFTDEKGQYFEYGVAGQEHIHLNDFND